MLVILVADLRRNCGRTLLELAARLALLCSLFLFNFINYKSNFIIFSKSYRKNTMSNAVRTRHGNRGNRFNSRRKVDASQRKAVTQDKLMYL